MGSTLKKKIFLIVVINSLILIFFSGCWNKVELNEKAIITGVGIDKASEGDHIKLTFQAVLPSAIKYASSEANGQGIKKVTVITAIGNSAFDAIRNFAIQSGKKGLYSHCKIIVIGNEIAKEGIDKVINLFIRDPGARQRTWLLVAKDNAKEIIEAEMKFQDISAYGIADLITTGKITSKIAAIDLKQYIEMTTSRDNHFFTTGIEIIKNKEEIVEAEKTLKISDTAIFKHYKLVGWFNQYETRGLLWITGKIGSGIIHIPYKDESFINLEIIKATSNVKPILKDENLTMAVKVFVDVNIAETSGKLNLTKKDVIEAIEKRGSQTIKEEIESALEKAKQFNTDVFDFGTKIYRKYPNEWKKLEKDWDRIFSDLEVNIVVETKIRHLGDVSTHE